MSKSVEYKQGATTVWSDGEKVVIKNPNGKHYIKDNVERIFGLGEYDKLYNVKYSEDVVRSKINPLAQAVEIVTGYIPQRVKKDLGMKKDSDYTKFFKED